MQWVKPFSAMPGSYVGSGHPGVNGHLRMEPKEGRSLTLPLPGFQISQSWEGRKDRLFFFLTYTPTHNLWLVQNCLPFLDFVMHSEITALFENLKARFGFLIYFSKKWADTLSETWQHA